jgi:hypothetical protein
MVKYRATSQLKAVSPLNAETQVRYQRISFRIHLYRWTLGQVILGEARFSSTNHYSANVTYSYNYHVGGGVTV